MSNVQIPNLPVAIALNGTEALEAVQSGTSVQTTVARIAQYSYAYYPGFYISQLPAASSANSTDIFPVVQGSTGPNTGDTRKLSLAQAALGTSALINPFAFGAVGDGTTDDTAAIAAAYAAVPASGGTVLIPAGYVFAVANTIFVKSKTRSTGGGWLKALPAASWPGSYYAFKNINFNASVITDEDIIFDGINLDWSAINSGGSAHLFHIRKARRIVINNCQTIGGSSATALLGCDDTTVSNCRLVDFLNCGADHWDGPSNAHVIGNYIESAQTAQLVNFNPDPTAPPSTGYVASGFTMTGNILVGAGANAEPSQIEPLRAGAYLIGASITGNQFRNATLVIRGDVRSVSVSGNTFEDIGGSAEVITNYVFNGGTASGISISGNAIRNPNTASPNLGVIRTETASANIVGNVITGTSYSVEGIYRGATPVGYSSANYAQINPNVGQFQRGGRLDNGGASVWGWQDASGGSINMYCQSDNNWIFAGTNAAGAARSIFSMFQRSDTSLLFVNVPTQFTSIMRQNVSRLAAAGTNIGGATDLINNINEVTSATLGVATGVRLLAADGMKQTVINSTAISINCYPNNSGSSQIDNGGANIPVTILAGQSKTFVLVSSNNFRTVSST